MSKFLHIFQERQFWVAVVGLLTVFGVSAMQHVDPDTLVNAIMVIVGAFVSATAVKDGLKGANGESS